MNSRRVLYLSIFLLVSFYLTSRIIYLDADLPIYTNCFYGPIDELFYPFTAFQIVEKFTSSVAQYQFLDPKTTYPIYVTIESLTALSLKVFGDNYYGLRMPSVFMGLVVLISLSIILYKRFGLAYAITGALVLICDFNFLLSNRVAEPTIHRTAGLFLLTLLFNINITNPKYVRYYTFFLGCAVGVTLLISPTNVFILPASLLLFCYISKQDTAKNLLIFSFGLLLIIVPAVFSIFDPSKLKIYGHFLNRVPGGVHEPLAIIGAKMRVNILSIGLANFLSYNSYILPLFIISIVFFIGKKIWNIVGCGKPQIFYTATFLFIAFICINAIPWSNGQEVDISIVLCVCLLMSFGFGFFFLFKNFKKMISSEKKNGVDATVFLMFAFFFLQTIVINDFPQRKLTILLPFFLYFIFWAIYELPWNRAFVYLQSVRLRTYLPLVVFLPALLISSYVSYELIYEQPSYERKEAMIKLNDLHEEVFLGFWSQAFRLYNSYEPVLNYTLQEYVDGTSYKNRMIELGEKYYPRSVTLHYADHEGIEMSKAFGYGLEKIVLKSKDPTYPDVGLYRYRRSNH